MRKAPLGAEPVYAGGVIQDGEAQEGGTALLCLIKIKSGEIKTTLPFQKREEKAR